MAAFLKIDGVPGEATDSNHDGWIIIQSMSSPVFRSIPEGAKDSQRSRGDTTLGDVVVVRELDKSSVKLQEACANGTYYGTVEIEFTAQVGNSQQAYYKYKLSDVIVSSYSVHANASGDPLPSEEVTLSYTKVEWTYVLLDPATGDPQGNVVGSFNPGAGTT